MKKGNRVFVGAVLIGMQIQLCATPNQDLLDATDQGDLNKVIAALNSGADINVEGKDKYIFSNPLINAVNKGHEAIVTYLLKQPALKVNDGGGVYGRNALHIAAALGRANSVGLLLNHPQINPIHKSSYGKTPYQVAQANNHTAVLDQFLKSPKFIKAELFAASTDGRTEMVKVLLKNVGSALNEQNNVGQTPLIIAAQKGHEEIVRELLAAPGIVVNINPGYSDNALMAAAANGHTGVVRLLLKVPKIDVNAKDRWGKTALVKAREAGREDIVAELKKAGATEPNA